MKVVAVIQARLGSTRLPAKVMLDLGGKTALERCLERVQQFRGVSEIVVATTELAQDDLLVSLLNRLGVKYYRGSEQDVLKRYAEAARESKADVIVRCTSDCPLLDPELSSQVIEQFRQKNVDYASNTLERRLPKGLDTEAFSREALERANRDATDLAEREHVTLHMYRPNSGFRCEPVLAGGLLDLSKQRWTLDTPEDYYFLGKIFNQLGPKAGAASMSDICKFVF